MSHDSRGARLVKGDRVLIEGVLVEDPCQDNGYCNCRVKILTPEQPEKPPMEGDTLSAINTRMLTKFGACLLLALTLIAGCCPKCADAQSRLDRKVDGSTQYNIGRSAEPPTAEAEKLFMTLITSDNYQANARERQVVSWINYDPRLAKLRASTRFNWYVASNPHYKERLRYTLGEGLPILAIQKPDGEVLLNVTAISMPHTSGELADMADDAVNHRYKAPSFGGQAGSTQIIEDCPDCPDQPGPGPDFDDASRVHPIPEVIPHRTNYGLALLIGLAVVVATLFLVLVIGCLVYAGTRDSGHGPPSTSIF